MEKQDEEELIRIGNLIFTKDWKLIGLITRKGKSMGNQE